tara:strand:- start:251 stop:1168 length:918 start_codon:yes stop_codon:yes gene_type:complete
MKLTSEKKGLVTKKFNQFFYVDIIEENNSEKINKFLCKSRKNIFYQKKLIYVGDEVVINEINYNAKTAVIENLLHRKNLLKRPSVANVSDIYIITSVAEPKLNYSQLSNFLVSAEFLQVNVSLILTKSDLISIQRTKVLYEKFKKWGYKPRIISLNSNPQMSDFINELKTKRCSIFIGPSGVGKTTLLNLIMPNINRTTSPISRKIKRGKNTTRNIELFQLSKDSYVVDTPGFNIHNQFIDQKYIANLFPEFNKQIKQNHGYCKFRDCLHLDEPGCKLNKNFERYVFYKNLIKDSKNCSHQNQGD